MDESFLGDDPYGINSILESVNDSTTGTIIYKRKFTDGKNSYTIVLYFPNISHSNTHGGKVTLTYSEMADMFMGKGRKWGQWKDREILHALASSNVDRIDQRIQLAMSSEMSEAKKRWNQMMRSKTISEKVKQYNLAISNVSKRISELVEIKRTKRPNFWDEVPSGLRLTEQVSWVEESRSEFARHKQFAIDESRRLRSVRKNLIAGRRGFKINLADKYGSQTRRDNIEYFRSILEEASVNGIRLTTVEDELMTQIYPWFTQSNLLASVQSASIKLRQEFINLLEGAKMPPIKQETKDNRKARGNSESPPLYETGEFANSLKCEVYK